MTRIVFAETPARAPEPVEAAPVMMPTSERLVRWITLFCRVPDGLRKGDRVDLAEEQKQLIKLIYDGPTTEHIVQGDLAVYLALATLCGPGTGNPYVRFATDDSLMWEGASPELRGFLVRDENGRLYFSGRSVLTT